MADQSAGEPTGVGDMLCGVANDYTTRIEPGLRRLLAADERLLAASPLVRDPGTTDDVSVRDEVVNLLDPTVLIGLGSHPGNLAQRAVFGRAVTGGPDSVARHLYDAVDTVLAPLVAVTTARLLIAETTVTPTGTGLLRRWLGPMRTDVTQVHAVARTAILGAVAAPAGLLRRGRLLIGFTDGSGCVLVCSPPNLAGPVRAAIGAPRPDGRPPRQELP